MNIAFFVSNHGFGHLMRELPVIGELLDLGNRVVLVTGEKQAAFARNYLKQHSNGEQIILADDVDVGLIVYPGTLTPNWKGTAEKVKAFVDTWQNRIRWAKQLFRDYTIDCVLSDIVPWAIPAGKELDIPTILCSNFTWLEQYEGYLPEELIQPFRGCYANPGLVLFQALASDRMRKRYPNGIDVGFFCRPFSVRAIKTIRKQFHKPIVYVSVGGSTDGLTECVDVSKLPYSFVVTSGVNYYGPNVTVLPVETKNTNDYIAASDYCITKAGWGTIAEEMITGKRTALFIRPGVPEDMDNIRDLEQVGYAIGVGEDLLNNPMKILSLLDGMQDRRKCRNNYKTVARLITKYYEDRTQG